MVAAGTVSAAQQEDAAAGHGGGFSRTPATAVGTRVPQGRRSADRHSQTRLYRKPDVIEPIPDTMARSETSCEAPADRAQHSSNTGDAQYFPAGSGGIAGQAETDAERASEQDSGVSETNSGNRQDASARAEFSDHPVPWQSLQ